MSTDKNNKKENHLMIWNELKWVPSEKQLAQFIHLQELLKEWNKKTNLSRLVDESETNVDNPDQRITEDARCQTIYHRQARSLWTD